MDKSHIDKKNKHIKTALIIITLIILIAIILIILLFLNKQNNDDKNLEENNKEITKEQIIDGLSFTDINLTSKDNQSTLEVNVTNNNNEDYHLEEIHITLKDKDGNFITSYLNEEGKEIHYIPGYIGDVILKGETKTINTSIDKVIDKDTYTIEYEIIK